MSGHANDDKTGIIPALDGDNVVSLARAQARVDALEKLKVIARALARQAALEDHIADLRNRNLSP